MTSGRPPALGDQRLTEADLTALQRAVDAKRSMAKVRGQWAQVDASQVAAFLAAAGTLR